MLSSGGGSFHQWKKCWSYVQRKDNGTRKKCQRKHTRESLVERCVCVDVFPSWCQNPCQKKVSRRAELNHVTGRDVGFLPMVELFNVVAQTSVPAVLWNAGGDSNAGPVDQSCSGFSQTFMNRTICASIFPPPMDGKPPLPTTAPLHKGPTD